MNKKIVILGAGYAGVLIAKKLEKKIRKFKWKNAEILLIDKNPYHTMLTELHEVAAGRVDEDSIRIPLDKIFAKRKVRLVLDEILSVDFDQRILKGKRNSYPYDYLVMASGCKPAYYGIEGAEKYAFSLWSLQDAVRIREQVPEMFRQAVLETEAGKRKELLTFVVSGAGFTGVEMAGELAEWIPVLCEKYGVERSEVRLLICDLLQDILMNLPSGIVAKAKKRMKKMGVEILTGEHVIRVAENGICLEKTGEIPTRTVIWACGGEGSRIIQNAALTKASRDRVRVTPYLNSVDHAHVYVAGDNMYYIPEGDTEPVPQMVENCERGAPVLVHNLLADITGKGKKKIYQPAFHGVMISIGGRYGIAYVGGKKKKISLASFFAMLVKHCVNMMYFVQVAGWNKVYSYLQHEFFKIENNRSFVGGHAGKRSPNFWTLPLRLFVGVMWLTEGIDKLPRIFNDFRTIFLFPVTTDNGTTATPYALLGTDAVTGASEAANWGTALPLPGFLLDFSQWVLRTLIEPIGPFFQASFVFTEVIIGLLLIAGLFSAPAAVVSIILCVMIYFSGWASPDILWYFFASIALIAGSGSTFGLDYYVLPALKKAWRRIPFIRKGYLYHD